MSILNVWEVKRLGTPEHVLLRAGMVQVDESGEQFVVIGGTKLASMFPGPSPPPLETIETPLLDLVFADLYDRSGYLAGSTLRIQAVAALRDAGITQAGLDIFSKSITSAIEAIKIDLARSPNARR